MKTKLSFILLFLAWIFASCNQKPEYGGPIAEPAAVLKDVMSFWTYRARNVKLYEDFTALDTASNIIPKDIFMKSLSTGKYILLKLTSKNASSYYKLYPVNKSVDSDTKKIIKNWGLQEYNYYKVEGTEFPDYTFVDIQGNRYNKESTRGKTLVVKCWFIRCVPCVQEMPALNALKQKYKDHKDVLFVSLCMDSKNDIEAFLKKKTFDYAIVPDQENFMSENLQVNAYPTHFVVNKNGKITNKTNDYKVMTYALEKATLE